MRFCACEMKHIHNMFEIYVLYYINVCSLCAYGISFYFGLTAIVNPLKDIK